MTALLNTLSMLMLRSTHTAALHRRVAASSLSYICRAIHVTPTVSRQSRASSSLPFPFSLCYYSSSSFSSSSSSSFSVLSFKLPPGFEHFQTGKKTTEKENNINNNNNNNNNKQTKQTNEDDKGSTSSQPDSSSSSNSASSRSSFPPPFPPSLTPTQWLWGLMSGAFVLYLVSSIKLTETKEITFQEFRRKFLETGRVESLIVDPTRKVVTIQLKGSGADIGNSSTTNGIGSVTDSSTLPVSSPSSSRSSSSPARVSPSSLSPVYTMSIGSVESFDRALDEAQRELQVDPHDFVPVRYVSHRDNTALIGAVLQLAFFGFLIYGMMRSSGLSSGLTGGAAGSRGGGGSRNIFSIGKSTAVMIKPGELDKKVTFNDVAGLDEAKVEVMEFVEFLRSPAQFTRLGAKIPKGALLVGPPGTGKTLLAKAVAGEASVPFFSISGSDFLEMFVGVGPSRVRDLFAQARANSPSIIFIDEIDAVGRSRGRGGFSGGHDERENTLNQLLVEMDGFNSSEGVVVLAGTNRHDILDKALLRPGRFDRLITIDKPDLTGRRQIFEVHLRKLTVSHEKQDLASRLAALTPGFTGADIANLCNEAALIAARHKKSSIELVDFEQATDRILGGLERRSSIMTAAEKKQVAYHEAGHAVIGWMLEHADPLLKVTIVPRGRSLGFAQYLPREFALQTEAQLSDTMCMALSGRAAEHHFFTCVSTGAQDDLQKVTMIAHARVTRFGMSKKLGNVWYPESTDPKTGEPSFVKHFSEATAQTIDEEVRALVESSYARAQSMIQTYANHVTKVAEKLIALETINHDILVEILGPRPFVTDAYRTWINSHEKDKTTNAGTIQQKSAQTGTHTNTEDNTAIEAPVSTLTHL